jgi:AcrR family transcriptional regulator
MAGPTLGRQRRRRRADETQAAILDAAEECFTRYGIAQTTIDDIVRVAKVPRATLYRHAGGKDDLLVAVTLREIDRFFEKLGRYVATRTNLVDVLVDGTLYSLKILRGSELLRRMLANEAIATSARLTGQTIDLAAERMAAFVQPLFEVGQRDGVIRPELTVHDGVEVFMRTIGSLLMVRPPWPRTAAEQRAYVRRALVPVFIADAALERAAAPLGEPARPPSD